MDLALKSYKRHYGLHWAFLLLLIGSGLVFQRFHSHETLPMWKRSSIPTASKVDWFFIIKIPEITTQHESGVDTMKTRITEWLTVLQREGFHPMLLSEVLSRIQKGEGVPDRTVVTMFNPGYRRTYEIVKPIFSQLQWPVLWLTDDKAMQVSDRRLVTYHTAGLMKETGFWDIAYDNGANQFRLESKEFGTFHIGDPAHSSWASTSGAFALNHGTLHHGMNYLSVNSAWLAPELLNRLLVELPPTDTQVNLSKGMIQGREWGLTIPPDRTDFNKVFDVRAPMNRRGNKLFFLGTRGIANFQLHVECKHLVGEFWTQLRVDETEGDEINIIYTDNAIFVVQQVHQAKSRVFFGPNTAPNLGKGFTEDLTLNGQQLTISFNKARPLIVKDLQPSTPGKGILQIYIADKPHGTARADTVSMIFTPLSPEGRPSPLPPS